MLGRGPIEQIHGLCATSCLPRHVGERLKEYAIKRIAGEMRIDPEIDLLHEVPANGPGAFIFLRAESERAVAGFSALGERGKRAEDVAKEAVDALVAYLKSEGCLDSHLADQILPFVALSKENSAFSISEVTEHLLTNLWVLRQFFNIEISIQGEKGKKGLIEMFNK
jgi:RNA 3'-terminal phosphate cyclase (ATP)